MRFEGSQQYKVVTAHFQFYFAMSAIYAFVGLVWGYLCWKNSQDLLPLQVCLTHFSSID